uniref:ATP synthase complex subunit 8 n=1 Tax=Sceloporus slevini TaxID=1116238 RepID=G9JZ09_9SAUR|nr:ATPase 8 [Sceloporus slevini]
MPQLNPSPWFLIMLLVWASLMVIFMNKTLSMSHPNHQTETTPETKPLTSWAWPWY